MLLAGGSLNLNQPGLHRDILEVLAVSSHDHASAQIRTSGSPRNENRPTFPRRFHRTLHARCAVPRPVALFSCAHHSLDIKQREIDLRTVCGLSFFFLCVKQSNLGNRWVTSTTAWDFQPEQNGFFHRITCTECRRQPKSRFVGILAPACSTEQARHANHASVPYRASGRGKTALALKVTQQCFDSTSNH